MAILSTVEPILLLMKSYETIRCASECFILTLIKKNKKQTNKTKNKQTKQNKTTKKQPQNLELVNVRCVTIIIRTTHSSVL